jgi:signal transduction histidine kinase
LLTVELGRLRQHLEKPTAEIHQRLSDLSAQAEEIGSELHRFSHELHPAKLEQLGLEASIRGFCRELAEARQIAIQVELAQVPNPLAFDVTLCLYRTTQEALQNVVKTQWRHPCEGDTRVDVRVPVREV